ncbi:MAG: glycerophosphodiester phosphodiesterase [Streptosporangiales bacterium]|nr:glycerophosphodiester phosphodiesterase [Streptosporangiales bacterium]
MAAFEHAVSLGYRYLETDAHLTADGVLVAFHDATLDRVTDHTGAVATLPWRSLAQARIGGSEPIPRLEELLTAWPDVRVNIDVKADNAVQPLVDLVRRLDCYDRICVASFSDARLRRIRRALGPRLCTSTGRAETARLRLACSGRVLAGTAPRNVGCAQVPAQFGALTVVTPAFVELLHAMGAQVHVWTVNTRTEMERLIDLGVDGIITDETETLRAVLAERGLWAPRADTT